MSHDAPQTEVIQLFNVGIERRKAGDVGNAAAMFGAALDGHVDHAPSYSNLATIAMDRCHYSAAIAMDRRALELDPEDARSWSNLGVHLWRAQRFDEAERNLLRAAGLGADEAAIQQNLGLLYFSTGRTKEAIASFERAMAITPDVAPLKCDYAHAVLKSGDLARGLKLLEVRWDGILKKAPIWDCGLQKWSGQSARVLLLHHEQGFGDTLQFCRFIPAIKTHAGADKVIFAGPISLHRLLNGQCGIDEIIDEGDLGAIMQAARAADYHCPLMSAVAELKPEYFLGMPEEADRYGWAPDDWMRFPCIGYGGEGGPVVLPKPYLESPVKRADIFHNGGTKLAVGLCWGAAATTERGPQKSCRLEEILELGSIPGVRLWSLQFGPYADQISAVGATGLINSVPGGLGDFAETASIIDQLDLVVTVDTATAHLAGAIGKKVFVLNPINPCWRWCHGSAPWYTCMTLYDQREHDNWRAPIAQIREKIRSMVAA